VRSEEADRVVAPVVRLSPLDEEGLGHVVAYRHQLDRGDAKADEVLYRGLVRQARVRAAQFCQHPGMPRGESAYMHLIEDRVGSVCPGPGDTGWDAGAVTRLRGI
jgi:hypothetical protein